MNKDFKLGSAQSLYGMPEQEEILEMATRSGRSREEVIDQAFAFLQEQNSIGAWLETDPEIAAHIEKGYLEAQRGELMTPDEVKTMLRQRRAARKTA